MCGICGFYSSLNIFSENDLEQMTKALAHRGPDAEGFFVSDSVGLGHRRLSIIDLSALANQPMHSCSNRYVIVYNGEVYNFKEIEKEICTYPNYHFHTKTTSDTEILIEAFAFWRETFVSKLNGMFAIAIYDKEEKSLYLFRDRIGIKPLYYYWDGRNFAFASELKALKKVEYIYRNISVNALAVNEYLHLGYIPQPNTIYNNIFKFPSGAYGKLNDKGFEIKTYWNIEEKISEKCIEDEREAKNRLKKLLHSSVEYRMISDVPFGTFLSGGIDSSLVTAIAQSLSSKPIKTFNIRFKDSLFDESRYAKAIADYLGTEHYEYTVTENDAINIIPELINIFDEPFADSSAIPTLMVSKIAKEHVSMALSGDGGDELFLGYGAYRWAERLHHPLISTFRFPAQNIFSLLNNRYRRVSKLFENVDEEYLSSHIFSQEQYLFSRQEIKKLLRNEVYQVFKLQENPLLLRNLLSSEKQSLFDLNYYLKDDLLVKVDRASMHYSLETRVPLLDYRIVELAYNLHPSLRMKKGITKYILKEILYEYVPQKLFHRPKCGFSIPLQRWMQGELRFLVEEKISSDKIKSMGIFNVAAIEDLKNKFYSHKHFAFLYNRLWQLMMLIDSLEK